ncbi:DUF3662 domain-containing protein [Streptomyces liliifuscus]|uniref:DUF3662 domain-containing protein n=1 Tax=Streptomyces liliifuscus TaxID=2797636 RepID=A0A7T7L2X2_9ACTN|nr:DUF3662 domain-containing protein [Streptomyces liliifuscus]
MEHNDTNTNSYDQGVPPVVTVPEENRRKTANSDPVPERPEGASGLTGLERALERFGASLLAQFRHKEPVELVAALRRECDDHAVVCSESLVVVPNAYGVELPEPVHQELERNGGRVDQVLTESLLRHGEDRGYAWAGPLAVHVTKSPSVPNGRYRVTSSVMRHVRAGEFHN